MVWFNTLRLKSSNPEVRSRALECLGESLAGSSNTRDTERIFASLYDENPLVRCAAVRALEKGNKKDAVPSLISALKDSHYQVREATARALGRLGGPAAMPSLVGCLKDPDPAVRSAAAGGLRALGWKPSTREEIARFEIALGKTGSPFSPGSAATDPLSSGSAHETTFQRRAAAEAFKDMNDPRKLKPRLEALKEADPGRRIAALHDVGQVPGEIVTAELLELFRDPDRDVRAEAAQIVASRADAPPAHFVGLLSDADPKVRLLAVHFLGKIRHHQIAEVLLPLLSDSESGIRREAATALGQIATGSAIDSLIVTLTDTDPQVRQAAEWALDQIDTDWMHSEAAQHAIARLEASLDFQPPEVQSATLKLLERLRPQTNCVQA